MFTTRYKVVGRISLSMHKTAYIAGEEIYLEIFNDWEHVKA